MAAVAPGLIPEMKRRGMNHGELAAMLGGSAVMTETIPPSLVLIMIGSATGISIGALFTGGLIPAVICTIALVIVVYFRAGRVDTSKLQRPSARMIGRAFVIALPALALPVVIRTAVVEGVATATEGFDRRRDLHAARRHRVLSRNGLAADVSDPGLHRVADRSGAAHPRRGHRDGLGADPNPASRARWSRR